MLINKLNSIASLNVIIADLIWHLKIKKEIIWK